ncbi:MAG: homoserine kinase [Bacillota bacterium]
MIRIRVPATSANLGPGFDVMGLAIDRYNEFTFNANAGSTRIDTMVHEGYNMVFEHLGKEPEPVEITINADIPIARGLGSSSSCIIGGMMGANELLGRPLDKNEILKIATEFEGHPDNVAPALLGGMVVSAMKDGEVYSIKIPIRNKYSFIALIPDFHLSTEVARAALPKTIPHKDGIHNVSRATLLVAAFMTGEDHLLRIGFEDMFHQPYRGDLIPGFDKVMKAAGDFGVLGSYLSGAGSTIMCVAKEDNDDICHKLSKYMESEYPRWEVSIHSIETTGAVRI